MTFPPCFSSSFTARPSIGGSANTTNLLLMNALRQQQQQTRLFSTTAALHSNEHLLAARFAEPRSATPDLMPENTEESKPSQDQCSQDTNEDQDQDMEDNAARMLLQLSQIVSKEMSSDSGCISKASTEDSVHKNEECQQISKNLHATQKDSTNTIGSSQRVAIPKSIEIHNRDTSGSYNSVSSRSTLLESIGIPQEVVASRSSSHSSVSSPITPSTLSQNSGFEMFAPSTTQRLPIRHRTVSLAGDEMVPDDRELSPLLLPLTSPLQAKDLASSFTTPAPTIHESPPRPPRHRPRFRQHQLFLEEQEALRRALVGAGAGAKVLSEVLAASAAASAAVVTPVPENPRPILSFTNPASIANVSKTSLESLAASRVSSTNSMSGLIHEATEDRKKHFPLELPPLLFQNKQQANDPPTVTGVAARAFASKPPKRAAALVTAKSAVAAVRQNKASKKKQPVHGPRANKKKTSPKKQQRQRHTGKKFSWKAYPELEEFLITNRTEYLSFSARNYTIEQRDYNNRLTSRLLEHAEASGYSSLFESCAFSAVRDRIRSYYKSYVQSFKRRRERQEQQERLKKLEMECH